MPRPSHLGSSAPLRANPSNLSGLIVIANNSPSHAARNVLKSESGGVAGPIGRPDIINSPHNPEGHPTLIESIYAVLRENRGIFKAFNGGESVASERVDEQ
jgi:hypothetical protein